MGVKELKKRTGESVAIVPTPSGCDDCRFCIKRTLHDERWCAADIEKDNVTDYYINGTKPGWCPLREWEE